VCLGLSRVTKFIFSFGNLHRFVVKGFFFIKYATITVILQGSFTKRILRAFSYMMEEQRIGRALSYFSLPIESSVSYKSLLN